MKKGILATLFVVAFLSSTAFSQWTFEGAWPDTNYKGGTHGIVVDPDGKIWTASYYHENWVSPNNDTLLLNPLYVFNPDGSLLDIIGIVTGAGGVDTLSLGAVATSSFRGMRADKDGNILYVQTGPTKMIKINYQTRERMGSVLMTHIGSSPTAPGVSDDGTIYVGPVVGGGTTEISTYDTDLNYLGPAVVGPPSIARTMTVSKDGLTIYWTAFTGQMGIMVYSRASELDPFELTDSVFTTGSLGATAGMSIESVDWQPGTGLLWVSNDSRGNPMFSNLTWYGVDVANNYAIVDSFSLPVTGKSDELPRGIAFSNDGKTAYVGLFGTAFNRLYRFNELTSVDEEGQNIVNGYALSQNYPNPFNPTTKISFQLPMSGYTTLKVYDMLGSEVATLVNSELASGSHSVNFDAANLSSGTYVYQLNVNGTRITNKMVLLK
ncbi:MAG TPA: T9SS type A sorting domain-containing protein [Ignavibacteriaceae bacterium]|nr:T9SS type A sorting domain-containing protein [Ignavibacteriaceae bacterium]